MTPENAGLSSHQELVCVTSGWGTARGAERAHVCAQIISWWYSVRTSASHSSASGHTGRSNGQSEVAAHACASMCDEMVVLWRLAVLDPTMSPCR